jgi:WD40 repeat protein
MLLKRYFSAGMIGLACLAHPAGLLLSAPKDSLIAPTPPQIQAQMARLVVRIDGEGKGNGSGFIINKNGNTYTVLTNEHVVKDSNRQSLTTPDGRKYSFTARNIRVLPEVDLAEITFVSNETYEVAKLSANTNIELGNSVYVYGWNAVSRPIYLVRQPRFASGIISQTLPIENSYKGNTLVFSGLPAVQGLSGSPVWDENGEVIGVYGLTAENNTSSTLGISIATYQRYASTARAIPVSPAPTPTVPNPPPILQPAKAATPTVSNPPPILQPAKAVNDNFSLAYSLSGVSSVAISPDGQTLLSRSRNGTIKVLRLNDGKPLRTLRGYQDSDWLAISPDRQTLVSRSWDNTIKVWRLSDGKLLRTLRGHQDRVSSGAISPDGQTLVSGSPDLTIKVWRLSDGKLLRTFIGHQGDVSSVAISPDGQTFVSGSGDKTINVWRLSEGKLLRTLSGHQNSVSSVAISPDGQTLVSGSWDNTIKVWRLSDGELLRTLSGHQNSVSSVAISPDGQTLVSGSGDNTIKVWRLSDGKLLRTLSGHQNGVWSVAISPDGQTLVSGSGYETINVWRSSP